ncbi:MAG: formate dehydrogenase, partial [Nostocoides sp.]
MTRVFVPVDSAAVSVGAEGVAQALAANDDVTVVRTGSRGMLWLEPLVEVETPEGRVGYPRATAAAVPRILSGEAESIGIVDEFPWLARQHRVSFARVGVIAPTDLAAYETEGG